MSRHRLVPHLAVRVWIVALVALVIFGWLAAQAFDRALSNATWSELEAAANLAAAEAAPKLTADPPALPDEALVRMSQNTRMRITVILPDGRVIFDSSYASERMENHSDRPEIKSALAGARGRASRYSDTLNQQMWYVAVPVRQQGKIVAAVRTAKSAQVIEQVYHDSRWYLASTASGCRGCDRHTGVARGARHGKATRTARERGKSACHWRADGQAFAFGNRGIGHNGHFAQPNCRAA